MNGYRIARYASTAVLSFFLFAFLMVFITGLIANRTIINPWYIVSRLNRSGFSELALQDMHESYTAYGHAAGIPPELMVTLITAAQIEYAAEAGIMASFGEGAGFSYRHFEDGVLDTLRSYAAGRGIELTPELEEGLQSLAELCTDALRSYADSPVFTALAMAGGFSRHLTILIIISLAAALVTGFLIKATSHRVTRWIDGYIYALGAAIIACTAIPTAAYMTGITRNLQITPASYNRFITSWIEGILAGYLIALIPLTLLLSLCITVRVVRWKKRKRYRD